MYNPEDSIDEINKYFGTQYPHIDTVPEIRRDVKYQLPQPSIYRLDELMRFVWRIQEGDFLVHIQDLKSLDKYPDFRIWFNLKHDRYGIIECPFGQISQSSAEGYLKGTSLVYCLLYSIGEWCKYNRYFTKEIRWKRVRNANVKWEGYINIDDRELLLYRIHDLDCFHLEYVEFTHDTVMLEIPDDHDIRDTKVHAELMTYSRLTSIIKSPDIYDLYRN